MTCSPTPLNTPGPPPLYILPQTPRFCRKCDCRRGARQSCRQKRTRPGHTLLRQPKIGPDHLSLSLSLSLSPCPLTPPKTSPVCRECHRTCKVSSSKEERDRASFPNPPCSTTSRPCRNPECIRAHRRGESPKRNLRCNRECHRPPCSSKACPNLPCNRVCRTVCSRACLNPECKRSSSNRTRQLSSKCSPVTSSVSRPWPPAVVSKPSRPLHQVVRVPSRRSSLPMIPTCSVCPFEPTWTRPWFPSCWTVSRSNTLYNKLRMVHR